MDEMIDRVEEAILSKIAEIFGAIHCNAGGQIGRAAIEAMREPTDFMNFKGQAIGDYPWDGKKPSRIFTAMIDAALATPPAEG